MKDLSHAAEPLSSVVEPPPVARADQSLSFANLFRIYFHLLPELERRTLQLVVIERKSYADTAEILGVESKAVRQLAFLGRLRVQQAMSPTLHELAR